jgi:RNA polymerase sigma-70 factor, ECF subfamily
MSVEDIQRRAAIDLAAPSAMATEEPILQGPTPVHSELTRTDLASLIEREYPGLRRLIYRQTGDIHVASDVLNDAVCITCEKWRDGKLARPSEVGGYIYQVAVNLLRNRRRIVVERADRRADPEVLDLLSSDAQSQDELFELKVAAQVRDLIRSMDSHRDRVVLVRFYLDEEDKEVICRDLGLTSNQFVKILHRARSRLRQLLEARGLTRTDFFAAMCL